MSPYLRLWKIDKQDMRERIFGKRNAIKFKEYTVNRIFAKNSSYHYYKHSQPHGKCLHFMKREKKAFRCKWTFILFVTHFVRLLYFTCQLYSFFTRMFIHFPIASHHTIFYFVLVSWFHQMRTIWDTKKKYIAKSCVILTTQLVSLLRREI